MLSFSLVLMLAAMPFMTACEDEVIPGEQEEEEEEEEEEVPESIKIAAVRSVTGPLSIFEETAFGPVYKFWEYEVNEVRGGIYVAEYGKKLPVEIDVRDDTSDMDTMTTLLEEMLATGDYHFALGPTCTPFLQAAGVICSEYEVVLLGGEGGATTIAEQLDLAPYMFGTLNYSNWNQMYELCKLMDDWQEYHAPDPITVYVIYIDDLHGWEYSAAFSEEAAKYDNIDIIKEVAVEPYTADIGEQLLDAQAMGADVFCSFTYPPTSFVTTGQAMGMGINFNALVVGPGACFEVYYEPAADGFGEAVNGVCGFGAWNEHSSPALADYAQRQIDFYGIRFAMDWWGHAYYYAGLHCLEQAIVEAGTLDSAAVREVLATMKLQTILGETWFTDAEGNWPLGNTGGLLAIGCHPGEIGQWQYNVHGDGQWIFEVIDIGPNNTAPAIYPKPPWPGT
jgi:branched-chain amino acid transport system substrate-binding protein